MITQDETVLEMLRRGPITYMLLPDVGNLRAVINRLRQQGNRIETESRAHFDGTALRRMAEYRLLPPRPDE